MVFRTIVIEIWTEMKIKKEKKEMELQNLNIPLNAFLIVEQLFVGSLEENNASATLKLSKYLFMMFWNNLVFYDTGEI